MPLLSIAENIFLGNETAQRRRDRLVRGLRAARASCCAKVGLKEPPTTLITDLGVGKQQLVEIAKALSKEVQAADPRRADREPERERQRRAAGAAAGAEGAGHRLDPDLAQAQRDRQGGRLRSPCCATAARSRPSTAAPSRSARTASSAAWSGATWRDRYPQRTPQHRRDACSRSATGACTTRCTPTASMIKGVNLHVRRGEIVGIAGLMGAGPHRVRDERVRPLLRPAHQRHGAACTASEVDVEHDRARRSTTASPTSPRTARAAAWCWRRTSARNITPGQPGGRVERGGDRRRRASTRWPATTARQLRIRCADVYQQVVNLSGGNQQKVVLAKWLFAKPGGADPRRADARHRRRRQVRDLHHHRPAREPRAKAS